MEGNACISIQQPLHQLWQDCLVMLYRPIIGTTACMLYFSLHALSGRKEPLAMDDVLAACMLNEGQFAEQRIRLEKYELLSTQFCRGGQKWKLTLIPPRQPRDFLRDEVFSRLFFDAAGEEGYCRARRIFGLEKDTSEETEEYTDVTRPLDTEYLEQRWNEDQENALAKYIPPEEKITSYYFDWDLLWKNMDRTLPPRIRTKENMIRIGRLASQYGVSVQEMRGLCSRWLNQEKTAFNFEGMAASLDFSHKQGAKTSPEDYSAPPVSFLRSRQPENAFILPEEKTLLRSVADKHHFANEVVNTLIVYCMEECGGKLIASYFTKVANSWARRNVDTRQKALEVIAEDKNSIRQIRKRNPQAASEPDWYYSGVTGESASAQEASLAEAEIEAILKGAKPFEEN